MKPFVHPESRKLSRDVGMVVREQRERKRAFELAERRVLLSANPRVRRFPDPTLAKTQARAMRSFGMTGRDWCGCESPLCGPCNLPGCGEACEGDSCGTCALWAAERRVKLASLDVRKVARDSGAEPSDLLANEMFDMHSHHFVDLDDVDGRIDALEAFSAEGVTQMLLSGQHEPDVANSTDGVWLDLLTFYAASRHPDFFLPSVRGVKLYDPYSVGQVELWAAWGAAAFGEFFVHCYGRGLSDITVLTDICKVAADYCIPVSCHWEIGGVEPIERDRETGALLGSTAQSNFVQLLELLDQFPRWPLRWFDRVGDETPPLKFILCHCGAGAYQNRPGDLYVALGDRMDILIARYPNVYFDIAGMHDDLFVHLDSGLWAVISARMIAHPDRFVVGLDISHDAGSFPYRPSQYAVGLRSELAEPEVTEVMTTNGPRILSEHYRRSPWFNPSFP